MSDPITMSNTAADELNDGLAYEVDYHSDSNEGVVVSDVEVQESPEENDKKRKRPKGKLQEKKRLKMEQDTDHKRNLATHPVDVIAEHLASKIRAHNNELSPLELSELYISKHAFRSTEDWKEERSLDGLNGFLEKYCKKYLPGQPAGKKTKKQKQKEKKMAEKPEAAQQREFIVIISLSAIRACNVHRATKSISGSSIKLINKNKLENDLDVLRKTNSRVLCASSSRVEKILNQESSPLQSSDIKAVVCDSSHMDSKKNHLFDSYDTIQFLQRINSENPRAEFFLY